MVDGEGMTLNLRRYRRRTADVMGNVREVGRLRRDSKAMGRYRVLLNGEDVADRAFFVDSRRGVVRMFLHRDGEPYLNDAGDLAVEERRGHVRLRRRKECRA